MDDNALTREKIQEVFNIMRELGPPPPMPFTIMACCRQSWLWARRLYPDAEVKTGSLPAGHLLLLGYDKDRLGFPTRFEIVSNGGVCGEHHLPLPAEEEK